MDIYSNGARPVNDTEHSIDTCGYVAARGASSVCPIHDVDHEAEAENARATAADWAAWHAQDQ